MFASLVVLINVIIWLLFADAEFPCSAKTDSERRYEDEFKRRILDLSKASMSWNMPSNVTMQT